METRTCNICNVEKPINNFIFKDKRNNRRGKICHKCRWVKYNKPWRKQNPDKLKLQTQRWRSKNPHYYRLWAVKNISKARVCNNRAYTKAKESGAANAHDTIRRLVKKGKLPSLKNQYIPCTDCKGRAIYYEHRNYNFPKKTEPVCGSCNRKRGRAIYLI